MLILTRRISEALVLDEHIYCKILGIKGNQVRLGFKAPKHIEIHREEIYQRIQYERTRAHQDKAAYIDEAYILRLEEQFKKGKIKGAPH